MKLSLFCLFIHCILFASCSANNNKTEIKKKPMLNDSTVFEKKDTKGRVIERWGNYNTEDRDQNFRWFFYYDSIGLLINEKQYFFEGVNTKCIILDTSEYRDIHYFYKKVNDHWILEIEKAYEPQYNNDSKFIGRKLAYIYNEIKKEYFYRL